MGLSPFDVLKVGAHAIEIWDRPAAYLRHLRKVVIFVGFPAGPLAVIGAVALLRQRAFLRLAILVVPILVVNVLLAGRTWEARQLLGLAPFRGDADGTRSAAASAAARNEPSGTVGARRGGGRHGGGPARARPHGL